MEKEVIGKREINIIENEGKVSFGLNGNFNAEDIILIGNTVILASMFQLVQNYEAAIRAENKRIIESKDKDKQVLSEGHIKELVTQLKGMIFDFYNVNATSLLQKFAPEFTARPDLTTEAIMKAENEIIEKKYKELAKNKKIIPLRKDQLKPIKVEIKEEE